MKLVKTMELFRKRALATLIVAVLLLSTSIAIISIPAATAHTPAWEIPTYAFVNVSPNPAGVGQQCPS